ncbi:MAG: PIG-L family deacetylase [Deinococcus sp.]|nr:PIG-L family deacetylase [Deinococcus sp.]
MAKKARKVMVIAAHPDDAEFQAGGTIARWVQEGSEVVYVIATRGDKGSEDPKMTTARLISMREAEQRAAAKVLGVKEVVFLDYRDGELAPTLELKRDLARVIRKYRPDIVITIDPTKMYGSDFVNHSDHRAIGEAALDAIYPMARDHLNRPELLAEGLEPHKVREVFLTLPVRPDTWIDIEPVLAKKIAALLAHQSQIKNPAGLEAMLRRWHTTDGKDGKPQLAEAFARITLD